MLPVPASNKTRLAVKLLVVGLVLSWIKCLSIMIMGRYYLHRPNPLEGAALNFMLMVTLLSGVLYYAIWQGKPWAKWVLLFFCITYAYLHTFLGSGVILIAGISVTDFSIMWLADVMQVGVVAWALGLLFVPLVKKWSA